VQVVVAETLAAAAGWIEPAEKLVVLELVVEPVVVEPVLVVARPVAEEPAEPGVLNVRPAASHQYAAEGEAQVVKPLVRLLTHPA